jgi:hypothetical protein
MTTPMPSCASLSKDLFVSLLKEFLVSRRMGIKEAPIDVEGLLVVALLIEVEHQDIRGGSRTTKRSQSLISLKVPTLTLIILKVASY